MIRSDCYFTQRNADTGVMEWFFHSREDVHGSYPSKRRYRDPCGLHRVLPGTGD